MQLGSAEHVELTVDRNVSPREIHETLTALALHGGASEVEAALVGVHDRHVDVPVAAFASPGTNPIGSRRSCTPT